MRSQSVRAFPVSAVRRPAAFLLVLASALLVVACQPSDRTPGQWLRGTVTTWPDDWRFTDAHKEIYVEVKAPWRIPHSVTLWCVQVDGRLYIGARDPQSKKWPGWVDDDPSIRLKIGSALYEVAAEPLTDAQTLLVVQTAYASKYKLGAAGLGAGADVRYWSVVPRAR